MACMEHSCSRCNFWTANNVPSMACPKCGERCVSDFDEAPDEGWDEWPEPIGEPADETDDAMEDDDA